MKPTARQMEVLRALEAFSYQGARIDDLLRYGRVSGTHRGVRRTLIGLCKLGLVSKSAKELYSATFEGTKIVEQERIDRLHPNLPSISRPAYGGRHARPRNREPWSPGEDRILAKLVEKHAPRGYGGWGPIAEVLGRSGCAIQTRWCNLVSILKSNGVRDRAVVQARRKLMRERARQIAMGAIEYGVDRA